jgi:hypothetical protein
LIIFTGFAVFLFLFVQLDIFEDRHINLFAMADRISLEALNHSYSCFIQIQKNSFLLMANKLK